MSDQIKHECGIAFIRLLKPLEYYFYKYGTNLYGLNKLYLLMEKQHNRGQDGAGLACLKLDLKPGKKYLHISKSFSENALTDIFNQISNNINNCTNNEKDKLNDYISLKENSDFIGEIYLGHLRYGTFGKNNLGACHPLIRENNWKSRTLAIAGNFNLTNVDELFETLLNIGQHPVETSDTITILEKIGHFLDEENEDLYFDFKEKGYTKREISDYIAQNMNLQSVLSNSCKYWDGGYVIAGLLGHGDAFILRDPSGIRPAYYYKDDEVVVVASERPVIQTTFKVDFKNILEIKPGYALIIKKDGYIDELKCKEPQALRQCSFERIYFSRGTDAEIYKERKKLGAALCPSILKAINYDIENTVFSYIPNTASAAFYGLLEELEKFANLIKKDKILQLKDKLTPEKIEEILAIKVHFEKVAVKDIKLRTFISDDNKRNDLAAHVYDITYGTIRKNIDNLVVIDDSIVRGTTLKQSIINILSRLEPKKIVIASSAPQIRYPDCYGIDMAKLYDFVAFRAAIALLNETKQTNIINQAYKKSKDQENLPKEEIINYVKDIYKPFTAQRITEKIAQLLTPENIKPKVEIVYQTIEDLHEACPNHKGDWYFTGNYPTPGGNKMVNRAFMNYFEGKKNIRAY
ncbi:MAG: amidophosphoribosyltransferase [Bacteroidales bacterium]|nr:amidophosphoribosyltransferase [Bacteroidales bacterium]